MLICALKDIIVCFFNVCTTKAIEQWELESCINVYTSVRQRYSSLGRCLIKIESFAFLMDVQLLKLKQR